MGAIKNYGRTVAVWLLLFCMTFGVIPYAPSYINARAADQKTTNQDTPKPNSHEPTPEGRIAFASDLEGDFEIYLTNPTGGGITRITDNEAEDFDPAFSPDGNRIVFTSERDGNQDIFVIGSNGSGEVRLTDNASKDYAPVWSPDGSKIAFTSERDGNPNIYLMNPDGSNQTRLTDSVAKDFRPAWSPDGARLAFTSDRDGNDEIYVMNADGSDQTNISNNPSDDLNPSWSPMRITFQSTRDGNDEIYSMTASGANQTRLTNDPAFDGRPARSSDGSRIAFVSNREGNLELYVVNADGSGLTKLTSTEEASEFDPDVERVNVSVPSNVIQFGEARYVVNEGAGGVSVTVTRTGDTSRAAVVDFATVAGTASDRSDYTPALGILEFAPGETSKTINIPIIDDAFTEQDETFSLTLANPTNATLGGLISATVVIVDNDNSSTAGQTIYAVTTTNQLLTFNSNAPGTLNSSVAITGLQSGEIVQGIDVRPANGLLYALGGTGRLYIVNPTSGRATQVSALSVALNGNSFGVDFNPVPDRLRVTSDADQNLRINVETGAAITDGTLAYASGDANASANPNVVASAYTNSVAGATTTTLYNIDSNLDVLVRQSPPNDGTLNTVGPLGVNATNIAGFDIAANGNTAFASINIQSETVSKLYNINLTTGAATLIGNIGGTASVRGIAVANLPANPIDGVSFFVRQQYLDFLGREPDASGLEFWTNQLTTLLSNCPSAQGSARDNCVLGARAQVSTAFFLSIEFQQTGYFVIRLYQEAFGRLPTLREFLNDMQEIKRGVIIGQTGALDRLASNRREFLDRFTDREEFRSRYAGVSNAAYVNALFTNAGVDPNSEASTRDALIAGLNDGTESRASVLLKVAETRAVFNSVYNRAIVLMQYFGYLRRDPDPSGFAFWLGVLNSASRSDEDVRDSQVALARIRRARIVEAFLASTEYRSRFGQP